jgi:hypothetical protein
MYNCCYQCCSLMNPCDSSYKDYSFCELSCCQKVITLCATIAGCVIPFFGSLACFRACTKRYSDQRERAALAQMPIPQEPIQEVRRISVRGLQLLALTTSSGQQRQESAHQIRPFVQPGRHSFNESEGMRNGEQPPQTTSSQQILHRPASANQVQPFVQPGHHSFSESDAAAKTPPSCSPRQSIGAEAISRPASRQALPNTDPILDIRAQLAGVLKGPTGPKVRTIHDAMSEDSPDG